MSAILKCLQSMQTALQNIETSGGYNFDVKSTSVVLDPTALASVPATEVPYFVLEIQPEGEIQYTTSRPNPIKNDFRVNIYIRLDVNNDLTTSRKTIAAWTMFEDVEIALTGDEQRGGTAMFTYLGWPEIHMGLANQGQVYLTIPVRILLQRTYGVRS